MIAVATFVAWPVFFCGARTGLLFLGIGGAALVLMSKQIWKTAIPIAVLTTIFINFAVPNILDRVFSESKTFERLKGLEESELYEGDIKSRFLKFTKFDLTQYMWQGVVVPFIGAGFYAAPHYESGSVSYAVGFGFHNAYLFAFEQGGVVAFVLFIAYLFGIWKYLRLGMWVSDGAERDFVRAILSVFIATLAVGMVGHGFWFGSTMHFSFYLLTLYLIAGHITKPIRAEISGV